VAWLGPALLGMFGVYAQGRMGNGPPATWRGLVWVGSDWLLYGLLTPAVFGLARRFPLRVGTLHRTIPLHVLAAIVVSAVWAGAGAVFRWLIVPGAEYWVTAAGIASWLFTTLPFGLAIYFAVLGIEHGVHFFGEARVRETQAARLSAQLAEARLGALRMQLHPHFLLNSLNAILVLVRDDDNRTAVRMLERLGEVLHRVLRADREHEIPLADEIAFLRDYLAVEEVRFSDRLRVTFVVAPDVERARVPAFVLLPLVENALRHGIARRTEAGRLTITAARDRDDLVLRVTDDGPGLTSPVQEGVGLANTRERLATLYGARGRLDLGSATAGGTTVTIRFPVRVDLERAKPRDG